MARRHEIAIGSETGAFEKGMKTGVIAPIKDASDMLRDLGKTGGPERLEKSLKDAQTETKDLSKDIKKTADDIDREFKAAYRKASDSSGDFKRESSDNVAGFKDEAVANLSEVASSFSGDLSQMADGVQGLTGGLASSLTPGLGIPIAIIGGIAGAFLASWQQSAEETEQRISDMYDDMLSSGNKYLSAEFIQKGIAEIAGDQSKYNDALAKSKELGIDVNDVIRAQAGDQEKMNDLIGTQNAKYDDERAAVEKGTGSLADKATKLDAIEAKYAAQNGWLNELSRSEDSAASRFTAAQGAQSDYLIDLINNAKGATKEVDALGNELYTLPDGEQILINADTQAATTDVKNFKGDLDGIKQPVTAAVRFTADTSEVDRARARLQKQIDVGLNVTVPRGVGNVWF